MSSLVFIEKKQIEDLLDMSGGYVLSFTNDSFQDFISETVGIDIYSEKYSRTGGSKARRLREFWRVESDATVGKLLSALMDVYEFDNRPGDRDEELLRKCRECVRRLLGEKTEGAEPSAPTEKGFLERNYDTISLQDLPVESNMIPLLQARLSEANSCLQNNAPLATVILCGSILEGILLGLALGRPEQFNKASCSPKDEDGKVRKLHEWSLAQFIDVAAEQGYLGLDVKKFSHALRDFRNYIHPYEQRASGFNPDNHTAEICLQVLKAAIASLTGKRK